MQLPVGTCKTRSLVQQHHSAINNYALAERYSSSEVNMNYCLIVQPETDTNIRHLFYSQWKLMCMWFQLVIHTCLYDCMVACGDGEHTLIACSCCNVRDSWRKLTVEREAFRLRTDTTPLCPCVCVWCVHGKGVNTVLFPAPAQLLLHARDEELGRGLGMGPGK